MDFGALTENSILYIFYWCYFKISYITMKFLEIENFDHPVYEKLLHKIQLWIINLPSVFKSQEYKNRFWPKYPYVRLFIYQSPISGKIRLAEPVLMRFFRTKSIRVVKLLNIIINGISNDKKDECKNLFGFNKSKIIWECFSCNTNLES